jgi:flavodoxin
MGIGIIVYSHTGHTLSVATKLKEELSAIGHRVALERLETVAPLRMGDTTAQIKTRPAIDAYDAVVFACPVRGGMPAPPMSVYLEQIPSLEGKEVACLVTGVFPAAWGRDQTLAQMRERCEFKGATVCGSESVRWSSLRRRRQVTEIVSRLSRLFSQED